MKKIEESKQKKPFLFILTSLLSLCVFSSCGDWEWLEDIPLPFDEPFASNYFWELFPDFNFELPSFPEIDLEGIFGTPSEIPTISSSEVEPSDKPIETTTSTPVNDYESYYYASDSKYKFTSDDYKSILDHSSEFINAYVSDLNNKDVYKYSYLKNLEVFEENLYTNPIQTERLEGDIDFENEYAALTTDTSNASKKQEHIYKVDDRLYRTLSGYYSGSYGNYYDYTTCKSDFITELQRRNLYVPYFDAYYQNSLVAMNLLIDIQSNINRNNILYIENFLFLKQDLMKYISVDYVYPEYPDTTVTLTLELYDGMITNTTYYSINQNEGSEIEAPEKCINKMTFTLVLNNDIQVYHPDIDGSYEKIKLF